MEKGVGIMNVNIIGIGNGKRERLLASMRSVIMSVVITNSRLSNENVDLLVKASGRSII